MRTMRRNGAPLRAGILALCVAGAGMTFAPGAQATCFRGTDPMEAEAAGPHDADAPLTVPVCLADGKRRDVVVFRRRGERRLEAAVRQGDALAVSAARKPVRAGAAGMVHELRLVDVRTGRVRFARTYTGVQYNTSVVFAGRGELAWNEGSVLRVRYRAGVLRTVSREFTSKLWVEDGRTLAWGDAEEGPDAGRRQYADLRPFPKGACPARAAFKPVAQTDGLTITGPQQPVPIDVIRICDETGRDRPFSIWAELTTHRFAAFAGRFAAIAYTTADKHGQYCPGGVHVLDLRERRIVRSVRAPECGGPTDDVVLTPEGDVAWLQTIAWTQPAQGIAVLARADGTVQELDRGALDGLRLEGRVLRWRHDGQERSAAF